MRSQRRNSFNTTIVETPIFILIWEGEFGGI